MQLTSGIWTEVRSRLNWRVGLIVFVVWATLEDSVRLFTQNQLIVFFVKDALLILVYLAFLGGRPNLRRPWMIRMLYPAGVLLLLMVVQAFNPRLPTYKLGLVGLRNHFIYVPLAVLAFHYLKKRTDLHTLFLPLTFLLVLSVSVALAQQLLGAERWQSAVWGLAAGEKLEGANWSWMNTELYFSHRALDTDPTRLIWQVPSIFFSAGRYGSFLLGMFPALLGMAMLSRSHRESGRSALYTLMAAMSFLAMVLLVARATIIYTLGILIVFLGSLARSASWRRLARRLDRWLLFRILLACAALVLFMAALVRGPLGPSLSYLKTSYLVGTQDYGPFNWRWRLRMLQGIPYAISEAGIVGFGTGTTAQGWQYLSPEEQPSIIVENGLAAFVIDLGVFGLILWLAWMAILLADLTRSVLGLRDRDQSGLAVPLASYVALIPFSMVISGQQVWHNYTSMIFFWMYVGIVHRLRELPKPEAGQSLTMQG